MRRILQELNSALRKIFVLFLVFIVFPTGFIYGVTPNFTLYITHEVTQRILLENPFLTTTDIQVVITNTKNLEIVPPKMVIYQLQFNATESSLFGNRVLKLHFYDQNHWFIDSRTVLIQVIAKTHYLVTSRLLKAHEIIKEDDLIYVYNEIYGKPKGVIRTTEQAIGKETIAIIPKGTLLMEHMIRTVPVIKVGSKVSIWYDKNNISIKLDGEALQDGAVGDKIKVRNLLFKKELEGEIVDSKNIKIITNRN